MTGEPHESPPDEAGTVVRTTERQGKTEEGNQVTETVTEFLDSDGNLLRRETEGSVVVPGKGVIEYKNGFSGLGLDVIPNTYEMKMTATDGALIYEADCIDSECNVQFGPGFSLVDEWLEQDTKILSEIGEAITTFRKDHPGITAILDGVAGNFTYDKAKQLGRMILRILARKQCARIPGDYSTPLYYKDDLGSPIDIPDMIHQCSCESKRARCPMCSDFGFAPATSCETAEEEARRECLMNPYGPRDEVRPECIEYLKEDNPNFNFEAHLCSAVQCFDGTRQRVSLRSDGSLACGCFADDQGGAMQPDPTGYCQIARCETGSCQCQDVAGVLACGCVSPPPPLDAPPAPPVGLGLPRLPDPLRLPISSAPSALLPR